MSNFHVHSPACLAFNELGETCCADLASDTDHLLNSARYVVRYDDGTTIDTFTHDPSDAFALARAAGRHGQTPVSTSNPVVIELYA